MVRVSKKAPAKKKASPARTQKKPVRKVGLAKGGAPQRANLELTKLATTLSQQ